MTTRRISGVDRRLFTAQSNASQTTSMPPPQFQQSTCNHCRQQRDTCAPRRQEGFVTILRQYHDINIVPLNCKWWSVKEQRWEGGTGGAATQDVTSALDGLVYSRRWWWWWIAAAAAAAAAAAVIDCASLPATQVSSSTHCCRRRSARRRVLSRRNTAVVVRRR